MTVAALKEIRPLPAPKVPLPLRIALRELRGGLKGFYVFIACIALGVAAIAAVGVLAGALTDGLIRQGQELLGADVSVRLVHRQATPEQRAFLATQGRISEHASLRALARRNDGSQTALASLKAVDKAYPLYGTLVLGDGSSLVGAIAGANSAVVEAILLERLDLSVGDRIKIGNAEIRIAAVIEREPDRLAVRAAFGPRVLMSIETLKTTGLIQPGSLIHWHYNIRLPESQSNAAAEFKSFRAKLKERFPEAGFSVRDRRDPTPGVKRVILRFAMFLTLVGLTALLIGGVGVANAVTSFVDRKRKTIATLKCLGATNLQILAIYLIQVLLLASAGISLGLIVGSLAPVLAANLLQSVLPIKLVVTVQPAALLLATVYGALIALLFAFWPLGRTRNVRPQVLFRDEVTEERLRPRAADIMLTLLIAAILAIITIATSEIRVVAVYFCLGVVGFLILFYALGVFMKRLARHLPRPRDPSLALARANLAGPTALTGTVALSLGTGLTLLITVALVNEVLVNELKGKLPVNAPDYFFLDIGKDQYDAFSAMVRKAKPDGKLTVAPMLRGRIVSLGGRPAEEVKAPPNVQWVLNGDRGLTYAAKLPDESTIVEGHWWSETHDGAPLVSFEVEIAHALGLKIGDKVVVNVLGRNVEARVTNFRTVDWESLSINFVMIFSPNTLAGAPANLLATLHSPDAKPFAGEGRLIQNLAEAFPTITAVRVRDVIDSVRGIFASVMLAVRLAGGLTLLAGSLVLAGALATAQRRRIYEAVILKTVGATKWQIIAAHMAEYFALAAATSVMAIAVGTGAAWFIVVNLMDLAFTFALGPVLQAVALAVLLVLVFGGVGSWRVLSAKTRPYLTAE